MDESLLKKEYISAASVCDDEVSSLSEIITVQAIICVLVSIFFVLLNTFYPQTAAELYDITADSFNSEVQISETAASIKDLLNSSLSDILHDDKI